MKTKFLPILFLSFNVFISTAQIFAPEIKVQAMPNNNVGVGTENPIGKLSILSSGTIGTGIYDNSYLYITNGTDKLGLDPNQLYSGQDFNFQTATVMKFFTGGYPRLTILENGKTGIGTENPTGKLSILSSGTIGTGIYDNSYLYITNGTDKLGLDPNQLYSDQDFNFQTATFMKFFTDGSSRLAILQNGNVGIGDDTPSYKLEVNGTIRATTFSAVTPPWSDFVFEDNYELKALEDVEKFIKINKHLPGIPSEEELQKNGLDLPTMDSKLLQKIEELTLYMIEMNKQVQQLKTENKELKEKVQVLENQ